MASNGYCRINSTAMWRPFTRDFCQDKRKHTDYVLGAGYSLWAMLEFIEKNPGTDPKKILDDMAIDENWVKQPAIMMEETSHSVWANSLALQRAGIDDSVQDGKGSLYMRNSKGELNGILFENAGKLRANVRVRVQ